MCMGRIPIRDRKEDPATPTPSFEASGPILFIELVLPYGYP